MELYVKHYAELTRDELFDILAARSAVFVVEQNCVYQDIDAYDKQAYHVFLRNNDALVAYLRVIDRRNEGGEVMLGRVISLHRRCGLGSRIVQAGIAAAKEKFAAKRIRIEAQSYAIPFYAQQGFRQTSDEFLEDGIPHVEMLLDCDA